MREIVAMLGLLTPLYLVFYVSLPNEIKLLILFNIFFFVRTTTKSEMPGENVLEILEK